MPTGKNSIRIKEFELGIDKKDKIGKSYRASIGKSSKSFTGFLSKNGVQNIHPDTKEIIIGATDEYITLHNIL